MSANQRAEAEALRAKYARCFNVPKDDVEIEFLEDEDARVFHKTNIRLPSWRLGTTQAVPLQASLGEYKKPKK